MIARAKQQELGAELAALEHMSLSELKARWQDITDKPVPRLSAGLLRLALAWELQASVHGGLSRRATQSLDQLAVGKTETRPAQPGTRLMREWNGKLHLVTIKEDGAICWNDQTWKSLSAVARAITGTRWSGPAFFGLKTKKGRIKGSLAKSDQPARKAA